MIIGIDASRANEAQKTGVGNYAYFLIEQLKRLKIKDLRFVLYVREPLMGELADLPENWTVKVLGWAPPFGFAQGKMRLWTQVRLSWEMLWHAPDVLFIPAHVFPIIHPKKTVMTIHDVAALKFPKSYNWFERWYSVWSARYALKHLWKVIVPSESVRHELASVQVCKCASEKVVVVRHGYDERYKIETKTEIEDLVLRKYNIKKPYLLSIGRLEEKKNTVRIIEAFEKVRLQLTTYNLQLVLVGKPGYGYEKVKEAIDASQFKSDIITPGWVSDEDLPALMRGASVFVFPSLAEGFGIPVLEAMAAGVPVVASRASASLSMTASQEVGGDACVYVDPMSVEEIAEAIVKVLENEDCLPAGEAGRLKIIEKGRERVKEFSWEKCAEETMSCLMS